MRADWYLLLSHSNHRRRLPHTSSCLRCPIYRCEEIIMNTIISCGLFLLAIILIVLIISISSKV